MSLDPFLGPLSDQRDPIPQGQHHLLHSPIILHGLVQMGHYPRHFLRLRHRQTLGWFVDGVEDAKQTLVGQQITFQDSLE